MVNLSSNNNNLVIIKNIYYHSLLAAGRGKGEKGKETLAYAGTRADRGRPVASHALYSLPGRKEGGWGACTAGHADLPPQGGKKRISRRQGRPGRRRGSPDR